jgi:hypothetical protein
MWLYDNTPGLSEILTKDYSAENFEGEEELHQKQLSPSQRKRPCRRLDLVLSPGPEVQDSFGIADQPLLMTEQSQDLHRHVFQHTLRRHAAGLPSSAAHEDV